MTVWQQGRDLTLSPDSRQKRLSREVGPPTQPQGLSRCRWEILQGTALALLAVMPPRSFFPHPGVCFTARWQAEPQLRQ